MSLNNQPCQPRATLGDVISNDTLFNPLTVNVNQSGGSCNTIDMAILFFRGQDQCKKSGSR